MLEKLAAFYVVHHKVNSIGFLENVVHSNEKWMVHFIQDKLLCFHIVNRIMLDNHIFSYALHCMIFLGRLAENQVYLSKSSSADFLYQFEVQK